MTRATSIEDCLKAVVDEYINDDRAYIPTDERAHARLMVRHGVCAAQQTGRMTYLRMVGQGYITAGPGTSGESRPCYDMERICSARRDRAHFARDCLSSRERESECVCVCVAGDRNSTMTVSRGAGE